MTECTFKEIEFIIYSKQCATMLHLIFIHTLIHQSFHTILCVLFFFFFLTFNGDLFALEIMQVAQQHFFPVAPVANETQIRQRALRRAHFLLHL